MDKAHKKELLNRIKDRVVAEGGLKSASSCADVLLNAAFFGNAKRVDLINSCIGAEFFYQALFKHYAQGKGRGSDVILGDYYGSVAIAHAAKTKDTTVLGTFCNAILDATDKKDDKYKEASRLAKIYGASAYVGAYLAGLGGLDNFYKQGEAAGIQILTGANKAQVLKNLFSDSPLVVK